MSRNLYRVGLPESVPSGLILGKEGENQGSLPAFPWKRRGSRLGQNDRQHGFVGIGLHSLDCGFALPGYRLRSFEEPSIP